MIKNCAIQTGGGKVFRRRHTCRQEPEIVGRRTVFAGADEADGVTGGGNIQCSEWAARRKELLHCKIRGHRGGVRNRGGDEKNAIGFAIGFRMVGCGYSEAFVIREPSFAGYGEIGGSEGTLGFISYIDEPEAGMFFVFVTDARVVLVLFLFFFRFGLCLGSEKGDGVAIP